MKVIAHYTVDITYSKDVSQEELDRLDKAWKVDELTKRLANEFKQDLQAIYPTCDSIVPTAKIFILEK